MVIAAGRLRDRITIQSPDYTCTASGQKVPVWDTDVIRGLPAEVDYQKGEKVQRADGQQSPVLEAVVTIRSRTDIDETMRVVHDSRNLNIVSIIRGKGHRDVMVLHCKGDA